MHVHAVPIMKAAGAPAIHTKPSFSPSVPGHQSIKVGDLCCKVHYHLQFGMALQLDVNN